MLVDLETRAVGFFEDCLPHQHSKSLGSMTQQAILWPELMFFSWGHKGLIPSEGQAEGDALSTWQGFTPSLLSNSSSLSSSQEIYSYSKQYTKRLFISQVDFF